MNRDRQRANEREIAAELLRRGGEMYRAKRAFVRFAKDPSADELLNDLDAYPHAFVLACVMDRQIKAERAWRIPYLVSEAIGGFEFKRLSALTAQQTLRLFRSGTRGARGVGALHRMPAKMASAFHSAVQRIADSYGGDASRIWVDRPPSAEVVLRFLAFDGVGPKIATMATNLLVRYFKVPLADYYSIDISVDVHVRRVFKRLALVDARASNEQIVYRARALSPSFPGLIDFPAWQIGREWCLSSVPRGDECFMRSLCPSARSRSDRNFRRSQ